jgi:hypothetical protein
VEIDTNPPQPDPVAEAIVQALNDTKQSPDAWWQAGIDEALESSSC